MNLKTALLAGALASTGLSWACPNLALAQTAAVAPETDGAGKDDAVAVTGVIVTGFGPENKLKRAADGGALGAKPLLDTPYSITVVDQAEIEKRQVTTIGQVFINDPSVFSSATAGSTNWWGTQIRGLGVRNYYIDDVPLVLYWGGDFPLEGIDNVQALKGLSGFMHGFGSPGGVISYKTKRPTAEPLLSTELGWRDDSVFFGRVDAGGPVGAQGRLGYRVNLGVENGKAYNDARIDRKVGSLALEYEITPDLHWHATVTAEDSEIRGEPLVIYWDAYTGATPPRASYNYGNQRVANSYYKTRTLAVATGFDWRLSDTWTADLTYGYTRKHHRSNKMFAYLLNPAGDYAGYAYNFAQLDENNFTQLMLQGRLDTGPIRHEIVAGASYQISTSDFGAPNYWGNDFNGNVFQPQPFLVTRPIDFSTDGIPSDERQAAVFVSDTLHFGQHWQAILGLRRTNYRLADLDGDPDRNSGYRVTANTPTLAVIYKPAEYVSLYASYAESLEPGTRVRGDQYVNNGEVLDATVSKQYEAGLKYEHRALSLAAAGFRIERANQIDSPVGDGSKRRLSQDGLSVYKGLEFTAAYRVSPALRLGAGALYLDPRIRDVSADNLALEGNIPSGAARRQMVANAEYLVPGVEGLSLHGAVRYFGKAPTTDQNTLFLPDRTVANVGFRYETRIGGRRAALTGNINNLFNKKYWDLTNIGEGINGSLSVKVYW